MESPVAFLPSVDLQFYDVLNSYFWLDFISFRIHDLT
jgi:hypothetical protein